MWRQQHVVGHHAYTNLACDPDIRVSEHDVRRVAAHHPKQPYHVRIPPPTHDCCLSLFRSLGRPQKGGRHVYS